MHMKDCMITLMEAKTARVKGITFHRQKSIVLIALHNGIIQAWDYQLNTLIHEFIDHDGPVRCILFHPKIDLFVSGGDDCVVRLWNYNERRVVHRFKGHRDYIRALDFHPTLPWILSASDDQSIRVWNFQSHQKMAKLTGHSHYVMAAKFLDDNHIVSGSLDQTIRIWDYSALKKAKTKKVSDIFGVPDVVVKQILDGHDRGINCIALHPNKRCFISGSDDRTVKVWEYNETMAWEKDTYHNHQGNVSSLLYAGDLLISVGEDGILNYYNSAKKNSKKSVVDERLWCVALHNETILGIGSDTGFKILSLEKISPIFCVSNDNEVFKCIYYVDNSLLIRNDLKSEKEVYKLKKEPLSIQVGEVILIQYYNSFDVIKEKNYLFSCSGIGILCKGLIISNYRGDITVYDESKNIISEGEVTVGEFIPGNNEIYFEVINKTVRLKGGNDVFVTLSFKPTKAIVGAERIAFIGTNELCITNYHLEIITSLTESVKINHGIFSENDFFYSTLKHVKYVLSTGDKGIIKSVDKCIFPFNMENELLYYFTKNEIETMELDLIECKFKKTVKSGNEKEILDFLKNFVGMSMLAYLTENKNGALALPFIKDPEQRFELHLSANEFKEAFKLCNKPAMYKKLLKNTMASDNEIAEEIAEKCFITLGDYHGLFLFYICSNQIDKIYNLLKRDISYNLRITVSLFLGLDSELSQLITGKGIINNKRNELKNNDITNTDQNVLKDTANNKIASINEDFNNINLNSLFDEELLKTKKDFVTDKSQWSEAMNYVTQGKIKRAIKALKSELYSFAHELDYKKRSLIGAYLSGLIVQKEKAKFGEGDERIRMKLEADIYFSGLPLETSHKQLALSLAMMSNFKHQNYGIAKELALKLSELLEGKDEESINKNINKIMAYEENSNKYIINTDGKYCCDVFGYHSNAKQCLFCMVWCQKGEICSCCEVGILNKN